ncbi:MAG TPA: hypothetical protein VFU21_26650 [Kofleriaceae bacterium]|nr:hypothetical protein [Kofleriaceae bacterium]
MRGPVLAALAGLLAACENAPADLGPFAISFSFDQREGSRCDSESCADYGMSCGATVGIRILDVADDGRIVADACIPVPPASTVCGMGNVTGPTFFNIPPHRLRIEAAAWRPEVLEFDPVLAGECPDDPLFDVRGVPLDTFRPRPAFAGAAYFDAGSDVDVAMVPLSCTDPDQLDQQECGLVDTTAIRVTADDIETALDITTEQASNLTVGLAEPRAVPDGDGGMVYVIESSDTTPLEPVTGIPIPTFAGTTDRVPGTACSVLLELTPQSVASVTCERQPAEADEIEVRGVLVTVETLDQILAAMGADSFPPEGLVVGRVVDHTGAPLSNVRVMPSEGTAEYLSADRSTLLGNDTSVNGLFIARDVPFGATWTAVHSVDGRRESGEVRAGLVQDKVTALLVRMTAP